MSHPLFVTITTLVMLIGLTGVVLPVLPGIPFMFLVAGIFAVLDRFTHIGASGLIGLAAIAVLSLVVDYGSGTLGARWSGASAKATGAGLLGMIIGTVLVPPVGGFIGMFVAILLLELQSGDLAKAMKAATGSVVGSLIGIGINLFLGICFIGIFIALAIR